MELSLNGPGDPPNTPAPPSLPTSMQASHLPGSVPSLPLLPWKWGDAPRPEWGPGWLAAQQEYVDSL